MGKPKFSKKKYETPSHPWQEDRIKEENEFIKKYGLKNKREIWKAETSLRKYRGHARELLAKIGSDDPQIKKESDQLLMYLGRMTILKPNSTLDDVLALNTESVLSRRLQTLTYLKGLASTPNQARQLIVHGHIAVNERKTTIPGYLVTKDEEGEIAYTAASPLNDILHPVRPRADFKSVPIKKEGKPEEPKEEKPKEEAPDKKPPVEEKPKGAPKEAAPIKESPKAEESDKPAEPPKKETPVKEKKEEQKPAEKKPEEAGEPEPTEKKSEKPPKEKALVEEKKEEPPTEEKIEKEDKPKGGK